MSIPYSKTPIRNLVTICRLPLELEQEAFSRHLRPETERVPEYVIAMNPVHGRHVRHSLPCGAVCNMTGNQP